MRFSALSKFALVGVIAAFSFVGVKVIQSSSATTGSSPIDCTTAVKFLDYTGETKTDIFIANPALGFTASRTYPLGRTVNPGKYDIYAKASDDHYSHRSTNPNQDIQPQKQEQFYVKLGGVRTPNATSDFTDFYDWHTGEGDFPDDDNNIITVPPQVVAAKGEFLGTITLTQATNTITFEHINLYTTTDNSPNSVIPYAIGITCSEPVVKNPKLEVDKKVDANEDSVLNDNTEQANVNKPIRWVVEGRNTGEGDDTAAQISDCLPVGLTYTPSSIRVIAGVQGLISYDPATRCTKWVGSLQSGQSVTYEYMTTIATKTDFASCDTATAPSDGVCLYEATIGSTRTGSLVIEDRDPAGVTMGTSDFSVSKVVAIDSNSYADSQMLGNTDFGKTVKWKVVAKNTGSADEPAARIVDTFAPGLTVTEATIEGAAEQPTISGQDVVWNGNLAANQTVTMIVSTTVANLDAFVSCDNATYPTNVSADQKCVNQVTLGVAGDAPTNFVPGSTKTDTALVSGSFSAELAMTKLVDGNDDDSLSTTRFTSVEEIDDGVTFTWKVHLENTGDAAANNVVLQDPMPAGVTIAPTESVRQTVTDATGNFTVTANKVSWNGTIQPGGSVDLEIDATIANLEAFTACREASSSELHCTNKATATAVNSANGQPMSGQAMAHVFARFAPIYTISKQIDGNADGTFSESFEETEATATNTWMVRLSNTGNAPADDARIVDPIPAGLTLAQTSGLAVSDSSEGVVTDSIQTVNQTNGRPAVVWNGSLPIGGFVEFRFTTTIADKAAFDSCNAETEGAYCRNTAWAGTANAQPTGLNSDGKVADDADVSLILRGNLTVAKDVDGNKDTVFAQQEVIEPSRTFTWRVRVSNTGDAGITNAAAYDVLPQGIQIIGTPELKSGNVANDEIQVVAGTRMAVFWHAPTLAPDTSVEILIPVQIEDKTAFDACDNDEVDGTVDAICTNPVRAGTGENPDDFDPSTPPATSGVTMLLRPELTINKEVDGFDADSTFSKQEQHRAGDKSLVWRIAITNTTNVSATTVSLKDAFPKGFTFVSATVTPNNTTQPEFDDTTNTLTWDGRIDGLGTVTFLVNGKISSDEEFTQCDTTDGTADSLCTNVAMVEYEYPTIDSPNPKKETISSSAAVSNSPGTPKLTLNKAVDANNDGVSAAEENYNIGDTVTWTVVASNTGDGVARNLRINDPIVNGQQYVENTASYSLTVPGQPVKTGTVTVANGALNWTGDLPVNANIRIIFRTSIQSLQAFGNCNFADGNVKDERCTNTTNLHTNNDTTPFLKASAQLQTKLQVVLAATGSRDTLVQIAIGTLIAAAAVAIAATSIRRSAKSAYGHHNTQV